MPRGDRLRNVAGKVILPIALLLAGLACAAYLVSIGWYQEAASKLRYENRIQQYEDTEKSPKYDACMGLSVVHRKDCFAIANEAARENERSERDLVAQEATAAWTYVTSLAAVFGVLLSFIGVGLIWGTFNQTRKTNEIAERMGQAQVRAYLTVARVEVIPVPRNDRVFWNVTITVFNSGQSPAKNLEAHGTTHDPSVPHVAGIGKSVPAGKDGAIPLTSSTAASDLQFADINETVVVFALRVSISYQDVFMNGNERTTIAGTITGTFPLVDGKVAELHFVEHP